MKKEMEIKLNNIRNLPTLPEVIQKLSSTIHNVNSSATQVAAIIEDDPAIMTRVLKVVNSAFYAGVERIDSIQQAVTRIGFTSIYNIALSTSIFSVFPKKGGGFSRKKFWKHCIGTGIGCNVVYKKLQQYLASRYPKDLLHLVGLIHDIGKIVLDEYFNDEFRPIVAESQKTKKALYILEAQKLGADHAEIGAWLARKWNLSKEVIEVTRHHHDLMGADNELSLLCSVADHICYDKEIGNGGNGAGGTVDWSKFGFKGVNSEEIVAEVTEEAKNSAIFLEFV